MVSIHDLLLPVSPSGHSPGMGFSTASGRPEPINIPSSSRHPDVIDLTSDSPPQSSAFLPTRPSSRTTFAPNREIIDLDAEPNFPPPPPPPQPSRRPTSEQHFTRIAPNRQRHAASLPSQDITRNTDVIILGERAPSTSSSGAFNSLPRFYDLVRQHFGEPLTLHYHLFGQFQPPRGLNYGLNAGHVYDGLPLRDSPGFKNSEYRAPGAAREGFTRSPNEGMTLVCPQCGVELGADGDEVKRGVWVAKCGHTYCGECAHSHRQNKAKSGAKVGRCLVDGCTRIISGDRGLIEVFLGE